MPYLSLKTTAGTVDDFPIYNPKFSSDNRLVFFQAYINKNNSIVMNGDDITPLVLKTTDMSGTEFLLMISKIVGGAALGTVGGPFGIVAGTMMGFSAAFQKRPNTSGYYLLTDNNSENCILPKIVYKSDVKY